MFKYYNPRIVKQYRSYTVEQICNLFKNKKFHPQTVREWVKSGELEAIAKKPISIYGEVLKGFLEKRNTAHKKYLDFNQFKCVKCQEIISPKNNTISLYINKNGSIKVLAICPSCNHEIICFYKKKEYVKLEETFIIKQPEATTLSDVKQITGLGRSSIYMKKSEGNFHTCIKLGARSVGLRKAKFAIGSMLGSAQVAPQEQVAKMENEKSVFKKAKLHSIYNLNDCDVAGFEHISRPIHRVITEVARKAKLKKPYFHSEGNQHNKKVKAANLSRKLPKPNNNISTKEIHMKYNKLINKTQSHFSENQPGKINCEVSNA